MMWFIPRSDPGATTEYLRPNGCGVSTESGTQLPYGTLPRLLMLWMYAEVERTGQGRLDLVYALSDYLLALERAETSELAEQAERLFACGLQVVERAIPVLDASLTQWVGEGAPFREVAPLRATQVELSEALREEMQLRQAQLCLHTVHAVQHSPFELDVYLWEKYCRTPDLQGGAADTFAPGALPRARRAPGRPGRARPRSACSRPRSMRLASGSPSSGRKRPPPEDFNDNIPF